MTLSKIRGCLLGGAIGDALGAPVEFWSLAQIRRELGDPGVTGFLPAYGLAGGAFTDDTQMTLFTAEGLIRARQQSSEISTPPIWRAYLRWFQTQDGGTGELDGWLIQAPELNHHRAPGNTCLTALRSGRMGTVSSSLNDSKGCGGVMRVAPVGLALPDPFQVAVEACAITHSHPSGYLAGGALAVIIRSLLDGMPMRASIDAGFEAVAGEPLAEEVTEALEAAIYASSAGVPSAETVESLGAGWVAEEALAMSVYCALVAEDFRHGVLLAVNHSGDADSTGSITGQLLGTALGVEAIPDEWVAGIEAREMIEQVADDLHTRFVLDRSLPEDRYPPG